MRRVIAATCLVAGILSLQGCGSGGGSSPTTTPTTTPGPSPGPTPPPGPSPSPPPSGPCHNPKVDFVTQSFKSTTQVEMSSTTKTSSANIETTTTGTATGDFKIDLDNFNARIDQTATTTVKMTGLPTGLPTQKMQVDEKFIVDAERKEMVVKAVVTNVTGGQSKVITSNCTVYKSDKIPEPAVLKQLFNMVKGKMQDAMKCGGSDGTYDTWTLNFAHKKGDPWPTPVPIPGLPTDMDLNVDMKTQLSNDFLMHSGTAKITGSMEQKGATTNLQESSTTTVTDASTTGPALSDLDFSSWGTCSPAPGDHEYMQALQNQLSVKALGKASIKSLIIATLMAGSEKQTKEVVV